METTIVLKTDTDVRRVVTGCFSDIFHQFGEMDYQFGDNKLSIRYQFGDFPETVDSKSDR